MLSYGTFRYVTDFYSETPSNCVRAFTYSPEGKAGALKDSIEL